MNDRSIASVIVDLWQQMPLAWKGDCGWEIKALDEETSGLGGQAPQKDSLCNVEAEILIALI